VRRCGVIGSPIGHSLSPALHQAAYAVLGLDWTYDRAEVSAGGVAQFVAGLGPEWRGLSVTAPCKRAIVELGRPDAVTTALGVANTLVFDGVPGDRSTTLVYNTDVPGIQAVLRGLDPAAAVTVWGNGATARSVAYALAGLGVPQVSVRARDGAKTALLAADGEAWGIRVVAGDVRADVLISTVPGAVAAAWLDDTAPVGLAFDVIYDPWPTPLATTAAAWGARVATGLDLLAAQAVRQVELMTGRSVDVAVLRAAADRALGIR